MQDDGPAHKSNLTYLFLQKRCTFINCWPANSPDLHPIDVLWGVMKKNSMPVLLNARAFLDAQDFFWVTKIWGAPPPEPPDENITKNDFK